MPRNLLQFAASMSRSPSDLALARDEQLRREREALEWKTKALKRKEPKRRACSRCGDPLPKYKQRLCLVCRLPVMPIRVVDCVVCRRKFVAHGVGVNMAVTCSAACRTEMKAAKGRHKRRIRDGIVAATASDVTPGQEAEMRRRVRRCPMTGCGVWMTSKPGLPNSKHLDHILPINQGGTHTHGNVRIICATCNVRRPKDGSDYIGPLTLWAEDPAPVARGGTCRAGLHPRTTGRCKPCREAYEAKRYQPKQIRCQCGALFSGRGNQFMCGDCIDAAARNAARLHASGLTWSQVAAKVGYSTAEGARYAAKRIGYSATRAS